MSYVYWTTKEKFKCPCGCGKELILEMQESEAYGVNVFLIDPEKPDEFIETYGKEDC